ncbi:hypothetical protein L6164_031839 [Bauhinia variegata]|uniref:Uncharacterized protein n=1 Tax=Bauhinia variegata TaxID=167791 RepID=A0ACB9KLW7_BAUVA|nr:hypothetical protein L6164_031839 [Bauhinia variegata]
MDGEEGLASAAVSVASTGAGPTPSPPMHEDLGHDPVPNAGETVEHEILAPLSDEDREHDHDIEHDHDLEHEHEHDHDLEHEHDHDLEHEHDHTAEPGVSSDDLKLKIIKQVEYYFSDENLSTDKYLMSFIRKNKQGFVPISVIASFRKMKKLTRDYSFIAAALRESSLLVVSADGKKVKRLNPFRFEAVRDSKLYTVLVENLPEDHSKENIQRIFIEAGNIKNISIHDPHLNAGSAKYGKHEILTSSKLHALVEFETIEAVEKAVATLNNEQDWRNGLRVKFLKQMGKYGQRKQVRKASDSEKSNSSRKPDKTGDEENHSSNEHHEDTHDEEVHQRGRNHMRPRKQKYRCNNGMGHGSTSTHAFEVSKPPPGPKMPDGTRGFTMGRGRPPNM